MNGNEQQLQDMRDEGKAAFGTALKVENNYKVYLNNNPTFKLYHYQSTFKSREQAFDNCQRLFSRILRKVPGGAMLSMVTENPVEDQPDVITDILVACRPDVVRKAFSNMNRKWSGGAVEVDEVPWEKYITKEQYTELL